MLKTASVMDEVQAIPLNTNIVLIMTQCIHGKVTSVFAENNAVFYWNISSHAENAIAFVRTADAIDAVVSKLA
jgi:hypothetical protein